MPASLSALCNHLVVLFDLHCDSALPYWDYDVEAQMDDPRASIIWSDAFFGPSEGDPARGHAVVTGRFAAWRIAEGEAPHMGNGHGVRRSPWNLNPSNHLTRYSLSCGSQTTFRKDMWGLCATMPSYLLWYACIDPTVHTWAHSFVGGIWDAQANTSRIPCYLEKYASRPQTGHCGFHQLLIRIAVPHPCVAA